MIKVRKYASMLCEALKDDFKAYSGRMMRRSIEIAQDRGEVYDEGYWKGRLESLKDPANLYDFTIEEGRKYLKVIMCTTDDNRSVHCFIDKKTGEVYKAASWKSPAKGVRFNLLDDNSRESAFSRCDWAGGYLYA